MSNTCKIRICRHEWLMLGEESGHLFMECERCSAVVGCQVQEHELAGSGYAIGWWVVRAGLGVSTSDFRRLSDFMSTLLGQRCHVDIDVRQLRRRRARSP